MVSEGSGPRASTGESTVKGIDIQIDGNREGEKCIEVFYPISVSEAEALLG